MIPAAQKLIERAKAGDRLGSKDRRHCVSYLMATSPEVTNVAMGQLFKVTESQIRMDRRKVREETAKDIKEDDIGLVIADIALSFDRQIRDIELSKRKASAGSRTYLEYCKAIFKMELDKITALQALGYYPKQLGQMTVQRFDYKATVSVDGSVDTLPTALAEPAQAVLDAEFSEVKRLAAPAEEQTV